MASIPIFWLLAIFVKLHLASVWIQFQAGVTSRYPGSLLALLSCAAITCLIAPVVFLGRWPAVAADLGLSALLVADIGYYHFFGAPLTLGAVWSKSGFLFQVPARTWIAAVPVWAWVFFWPQVPRNARKRWAIVGLVVAGFFGLGVHTWRLRQEVYYQEQYLPLYPWMSLPHQFLHEGLQTALSWQDQRDRRQESRRFLEAQSFPAAPVQAQPAGRDGPNILIVQVESLDASVVEKSVGGVEIMPFFNQMIREGIYLDHFYALLGAGNSSDAGFLTLTSEFPSLQEPAFLRYARTELPSLPAAFNRAGYTTYGAHGYIPSFWNRGAMYRNMRFQVVKLGDDFRQDVEKLGWAISDREFLHQVIADLAQLRRPFFAHSVTLSTHYPYDDFPPGSQIKIPSQGDALWDGYLQAAAYLDRCFRVLVEELKAAGLLEKTILVIYGDHRGHAGHELDGLQLPASLPSPVVEALRNRVPCLIYAPGRLAPARVHRTAGHLDLAPTIAALAGLPPSPYWMGRNILDEAAAERPGVLDPSGELLLRRDAVYLANQARDGFVHKQSLATGAVEAVQEGDIGGWLRSLKISRALLETDYLRLQVQPTHAE